MPFQAEIKSDNYTKIIVWNLVETNEELLDQLQLEEYRLEKYNTLTEKRKKEFLGIRMCLKYLGKNVDVLYDKKGRPYLDSDNHLSITHSHGKVAVGISRYKIGIDIEKKRDVKIQNIKQKFIRPDENFVANFPELENDYLHIIWGIKESLYKLDGGEWWNFLLNYRTENFNLQDKYINCWITKEIISNKYYAFWHMIDDFYLVIVVDYP